MLFRHRVLDSRGAKDAAALQFSVFQWMENANEA